MGERDLSVSAKELFFGDIRRCSLGIASPMGIAAARSLNFGLIVFDRALKVRLKLSARSVRVFR